MSDITKLSLCEVRDFLRNGEVSAEAAVKAFQQIFNLTQSGEVDKATWYQIKRYYAGVKKLSELVSEGVSIEEAQVPFTTTLKEGSSGDEVRLVQYLLNILAYFNGTLSSPPIDGFYGPSTTQAVRTYQEFYGQVGTAAQRMREIWFYLIHMFEDAERLNKKLRRFKNPGEYEAAEAAIFAELSLRKDSVGDLI